MALRQTAAAQGRSLLASTSRLSTRIECMAAIRQYASPSDQGSGSQGATPPPPPQPVGSVGSAQAGEQAAESSNASPRRRRRGGNASEVGLAAASLLPPLPLFRRILKAHDSLPLEMKSLGDSYVRDEFKRHTNIDNPLQIVGFLTQWKVYLDQLEQQNQGDGYRGAKLNLQQFEKLSDEQLYQLHELMTATREMYDPEKAQAQPPGGKQAVHDAVEDALQRARDEQAESGSGGSEGGKGSSAA